MTEKDVKLKYLDHDEDVEAGHDSEVIEESAVIVISKKYLEDALHRLTEKGVLIAKLEINKFGLTVGFLALLPLITSLTIYLEKIGKIESTSANIINLISFAIAAIQLLLFEASKSNSPRENKKTDFYKDQIDHNGSN